MSFLVGEQVVLTNTFLVGSTPTDPTTASLTVTDPTGEPTTYTWAGGTLNRTGVGVFTKTITATVAGTWTYTWVGTGNAADIAPGFFEVKAVTPSYVTLAEIQAMPDLGNSANPKTTTAKITAAIDWFEATFEDATGVAWVPRTATETLSGQGSRTLLLSHLFPRTITAAAITTAGVATALTAAELADIVLWDHGQIARLSLGSWPLGNRNISVTYSHGLDSPPADVVEAAKVAVRDRLLNPDPNRQFSVATEIGIVRNSTPGPRSPFGIQFVDEVVARRSHRVPGVA